MTRSVAAALLIVGLLSLPGCLWVPGTVTAVLATRDRGGHSKAPSEPALPAIAELDTRAGGPYYLLDGQPLAVVMGDFLPGEVAGALDVALIFQSGNRVVFYEGDGEGRLRRHSSVRLKSENTVALEVVPGVEGELAGVLVATAEALELLRWSEGRFVTSSLGLGGPDDVRDLVVLGQAGDAVLEVAVSSLAHNAVEFFSLSPDHRVERSSRGSLSVNRPLGLTAADYNRDGQSDLAILAEEGARTILLVHLRTTGGDWLKKPDGKVSFNEPARALAHGRFVPPPGTPALEFDVDGDKTPDIVASRSDGTVAVLVKTQGDTVSLDVEGGARHFSPNPAGVLALHLPGGFRETWDRVTIDQDLQALVCSYFPCKGNEDAGIQAERTVTYPLPVSGADRGRNDFLTRAVAAGDLNGDGIEDLVAVNTDSDTPALTVLLARNLPTMPCDPKRQDWPQDPFYYPSAVAAGERSARRQPARLGRLAHGSGVAGEQFLPVVDRDNEELAVFFLDPRNEDLLALDETGAPRQERYVGLGHAPVGIVTGPFDVNPGDDVVVGAEDALHFLHYLGPGGTTRFLKGEPIRFAEELEPSAPWAGEGVSLEDFEIQNPCGGFFDDNAFLDLAVPLRTSLPERSLVSSCSVLIDERTGIVLRNPDGSPVLIPVPVDFVIVILNPWAPEETKDRRLVKFYRVPNGPRRLEAANLNGDKAVDLIVACGGGELEGSNVVYLLFGDPDRPGTFFDRPGDPAPPMALCAPEGSNKAMAAVTSSNSVFQKERFLTEENAWPVVEWIVSCSHDGVHFYRRTNPLSDGDPIFEKPESRFIGTKEDPEGLLVGDFYPDSSGLLDLAVIFEAEDTGVLLLQNDGSKDRWPWQEVEPILPVGAPQEVVLIPGQEDLTIAVAARTMQQIEFYQRVCVAFGCTFTGLPSIPVARPNLPGHFTGFSASFPPEGGLALAFCLEDDLDGSSLVDLGLFPKSGGVTPEELLGIGEGDSPAYLWRVSIEPPAENLLNREWPAALCLGTFGSQGNSLDFLASFPNGSVACYRASGAEKKTLKPEGKSIPGLQDLVDWREVEPGVLAVATRTEVGLYRIGPGGDWKEPEWRSTVAPGTSILRLATGWTSRRKVLNRNLFLACLETARVRVETLEGAYLELLAVEQEDFSVVAAADLNRDERDDLAVVDSRRRLQVFLQDGPEGSISFTRKAVVEYPGFAEPVDLIPFEATGDTARDLALGTRNGEIFVFLGNGVGSFTEPGLLYAGPALEGIRAYDLDGDGRDEILAAVGHPGLVILAGQWRRPR